MSREVQEKDLTSQILFEGLIIKDYGTGFILLDKDREVRASVSGKLRNQMDSMPVIGDWVVFTYINNEAEALIHEIKDRKTSLTRKIAGTSFDKQVLGVNFDEIWIVMSLNQDYNIRKLERFILAAWDTGAKPVVILTKLDLCQDLETIKAQVAEVAIGMDVYYVSAVDDLGMSPLRESLGTQKTIALFGASGVGKSTLVNTLAGQDIMKVKDIRAHDDRGMHTTTHREMIRLNNQVMMMDMPGIREFGVVEDHEGLKDAFMDVTALSKTCRFADCRHENEPGCAVRQAIDEGSLDQGRFNNYLKLKKEAAYMASKTDQRLKLAEKKKWKQINKNQKQLKTR